MSASESKADIRDTVPKSPLIARSGHSTIADHVAGEIVEDRCYGCQLWPVRQVPIGRGGGAEGTVPENTEPD